MKKLFILLAFVGFNSQTFAQDIITKKDATEIKAKVIKVGDSEIEYKQWTNPDGPIYTIPTRDVFTINYENGQREIISLISNSSSRPKASRPKGDKLYQGEIATGYAVGISGAYGRFFFETVHGARISPYFFIGAGAGYSYGSFTIENYWPNTDWTFKMMHAPIFASAKGYYPISDKLSVHFSSDFGVAIGFSDASDFGTPFYTAIGPGISYGKKCAVTFNVRYQYMNLHSFLFAIGLRF